MSTHLVVYYGIGILATFVSAGMVFWTCLRRNRIIPRWLLMVLLAFPTYVVVAQILKFQSLHMYADFSHWLQVVYNIANRWVPGSLNADFLIPGIQNYFSVHFVPLIYVFGVMYKMLPFPETLLVLNGVLMLSSALPMYLLAKRLVGHRLGLIAAVLLLWYPTFQYITLYEFEMLRFSIPVILWMLYFWEKKRMLPFSIFLVLALLVREEVSLVIAFFGIHLLFVEGARVRGALIMVVGISYFAAVVSVVMGAFSPFQHYTYTAITGFTSFGATPFEVVKSVLMHPLSAISLIFNPIKVANVAMYVIPLLLAPLFAPSVLVSALPNVGVVLLSAAATNSSYMLYYLAPTIPFLFYAFLRAWPRIATVLSGKMPEVSRVQVESAMMGAMLSGIVVANVFFGPSPIALQFWNHNLQTAPFRTQNFNWSEYRVTDHHRKADMFVRLIPDDAIVSAEQFLVPKLFQKKGTMIFPQLESVDGKYKAEYVFIDKSNPVKTGIATVPGSWDGLRENPQFYYDWIEKDPRRWELIKADDGYELYRRRS